nr:hypothetical protein CFP56_04097 [Quercus suber]
MVKLWSSSLWCGRRVTVGKLSYPTHCIRDRQRIPRSVLWDPASSFAAAILGATGCIGYLFLTEHARYPLPVYVIFPNRCGGSAVCVDILLLSEKLSRGHSPGFHGRDQFVSSTIVSPSWIGCPSRRSRRRTTIIRSRELRATGQSLEDFE